jgi:hypothetical protein
VQVSILMVSTDEVLSQTRALLLRKWHPVLVDPDVASQAIRANAWHLLIICQTVRDDIAANLALQMTTLQPSAKVMTINRAEEIRNFHSLQFTVDVVNPSWLPNAVASVLSAAAPCSASST